MQKNITLLTDLYQLTMMNGYFVSSSHNTMAVFDLFFRAKAEINYGIMAGLEQAIDYIKNLSFTKDDIKYLKNLKIFDENFLQYLNDFKFSGDVWAVAEGDVVFPNEPILIVKAPIIEAQLLETALLNIINHQTLIATKASKMLQASKGKEVIEYGLRRALGPDSGIYGTRASMIGGCTATSNVLGGKLFDVAVKGTHGHSWVLSYPSELEAFKEFAKVYPDSCLLLVDTYDTLNSGVPNAITVFNELKAKGHKPLGIRLDSGDLAYLSKMARTMLDEAGFNDAIIIASNDIDEYLISELEMQGAKIDIYGVGTKLVTASNISSLGGVYKLTAIERKDKSGKKILEPVMKFSDSENKSTNPAFKNLYRIYDIKDGKAKADLITLDGEEISKPLTLTHPIERWKTTTLEDFIIRPMLNQIFKNGKLVYKVPPLSQTIAFSKKEQNKFWDEYKRLTRPHLYKVNLSDGLYKLKNEIQIRQKRL